MVVGPRWTESSDRHGIARADQVYAIVHAKYSDLLADAGADDGQLWLYIGHPYGQTEREVEVLVRVYPGGRPALIFHAMELGPKFRRYREEHPHD